MCAHYDVTIKFPVILLHDRDVTTEWREDPRVLYLAIGHWNCSRTAEALQMHKQNGRNLNCLIR